MTWILLQAKGEAINGLTIIAASRLKNTQVAEGVGHTVKFLDCFQIEIPGALVTVLIQQKRFLKGRKLVQLYDFSSCEKVELPGFVW